MPWGSMGEIWAEMGLNYSGLKNGTQAVSTQLGMLDKNVQKTVKGMEAAISQSLSKLGEDLQFISKKHNLLGDSFDASAAKARALESALDEMLRQGFDPADKRVQSLANQLKQLNQEAQNNAATAAETGSRWASVGDTLTRVGGTLSLAVSAPLALIGRQIGRASMEFSSAMTNVWTEVDMTSAELAAMGTQVEALSLKLPQTATQLADGLYQVIGAAIPAEQSMYVLEIAAKSASAGVTDTYTSVDALTTVLNAYTMSADQAGRVSDVLFKAAERGKMTYGQMAANLGEVISTAAAAGVSFEEVAGAFATLTRGGVSVAESATAVNQAILSLVSPSAEAAKMAQALGIEFDAQALASKGLAGVLEDVERATGGNVETLAQLFPNVRALKGVLGLLRNDVQDYRSDLLALNDAMGATDKAFEKQQKNTATQWQEFKNLGAMMARSIGAEMVPMLLSLAQSLAPVIQAFTDLPTGMKRAIVGFGLFAVALGPVLTAIGGFITLMTGPAGWVIAIGAAVAALYGLIASSQDATGKMRRQADESANAVRKLRDQAAEYDRQAKTLSKLLDRYEDLRKKAKTSKDAQQELNDVIKQIGEIAPDVVTKWDEMGNAVAINAGKAKTAIREMLEARKAFLEAALSTADLEIPKLQKTIAENGRIVESSRKRMAEAAGNLRNAELKLAEAHRLEAQWQKATTEEERKRIKQEALDKGLVEGIVPPGDISVWQPFWAKSMVDLWDSAADAAVREQKRASNVDQKVIDDYTAANMRLAELNQQRAELNTIRNALAQGKEVSLSTATTSEIKNNANNDPSTPTPIPGSSDAMKDFEAFGAKIQALGKGTYADLQQAWRDIAAGLKSDDIAVRTVAEERFSKVMSAFRDKLLETGGEFEKAAAAVQDMIQNGYKELGGGTYEFEKAMAEFKDNSVIQNMTPETQLAELENIKSLYAKTADEIREIDARIAEVREKIRKKSVQDAYDQYEAEAEAAEYTTEQRIASLEQLLKNEKLTADERKDLEEELALYRRRLLAEDAEADRNYFDLRRKLGKTSVQEELAAAQKEAESHQKQQTERADAAYEYYATVVDLAADASTAELEYIKKILEAQREKYLAMGAGWEEYVAAIDAALGKIDEQIDEQSQTWAQKLGRMIVDQIGTLGELWKTYQDTAKEIADKRKNEATAGETPGFSIPTSLAALGEVILQLLLKSRAFQKIMDILNEVAQVLADTFGTLLEPLVPILRILTDILMPALKAVATVFRWVADVIVWVWNALVTAINWALGWLGVHVDTIDDDWRKKEGFDNPGSGSVGTQISEITGPTRDLLVETLRPLTVLDSLPVYASAIETAIHEMRDAFLAFVGAKAAADGATAAIQNQYNIQNLTVNATIEGGESSLDDLVGQIRLAAEGSGA